MSEASFPRLAARTRKWTLGEPRSFVVAGRQVLFLRALTGDDPTTALWAHEIALDGIAGPERLLVDPRTVASAEDSEAELARRERVRERANGVVSFSVDRAGSLAAALLGGRLLVVEVGTGAIRSYDIGDDAFDPQIDPTGRRVGFCRGRGFSVVDLASGTVAELIASPDDPAISWGRAEHAAAEEMGRYRGFWWAPSGSQLVVARVDESEVSTWWIASPISPELPARSVRYPAAGSTNAAVSLWSVSVVPGREPVQFPFDSNDFCYVAAVAWPGASDGAGPIVALQNRAQTQVEWLRYPSSTSPIVLAIDADPTWVELFDGAPALLGDELVRIADVDGFRRLLIGDVAASPTEIHVEAIRGIANHEVVITGYGADPGCVGVWAVSADGCRELAAGEAVHTAWAGSEVVIVSTLPIDGPAVTAIRTTVGEFPIRSATLDLPFIPIVDRFVTPSGVHVGLVFPRGHVSGTPLPVLMDPYGGPHAQRVRAASKLWLEPQWWADQGYAVVVADGRGTPGMSVAWEQSIHGDLATGVLEDQVEALTAAAARHPELDLTRVAIRGWSFGGYLAALAVLRRPDVFHAAVAGAPVIDWRLYDTHYTERYLGTDSSAASYDESSLLQDAPGLARPLLLVHGLADDNVVVAHTLRMSQALTEAGRAHSVLPLSGVTHMASDESVAENLLLLQRDFIAGALGLI